ncbi:hypothetical protein N7527_000157 [Penicillium freii]|nr:hypothetical protein N7527_000157 [Penicillium freii]
MPRTNLELHANMKGNEASLRRIWMPLRLDSSDHPQNALDRQSVINLIRSVYDPLLIAWVAEPGHTWQNQFSTRSSGNPFQAQIRARIRELPGGVQSIESEQILGGILYDILRFYRFTDAAWRVPLPGAAAAPAPAPAPILAPAPALSATPSDASSGLIAANLDVLTDAAIQVLGSTASPEGSSGDALIAANLDVLTDAAIQVLGSTASPEGSSGDALIAANLDVLTDAAIQVLGSTASPEGSSGDALIAANLDVLTDAAIQVLGPTPLEILAEVASSAEPSPVDSRRSSLDILAAAAATRPYIAVTAPAAALAPGVKRGRDDETEDESEQHAKKKQAVSPK